MLLVTSEQMRCVDAAMAASGVPGLALMERAGRGIAERIEKRFGSACGKGALVVAGPGNNGGDGFVIARHLASRGYSVRTAVLTDLDAFSGDALSNLERWRREGGAILDLGKASDEVLRRRLSAAISETGVIVDAILGTGLRRPLAGRVAAAVETINTEAASAWPRPVLSVDIPSGLCGERGEPRGDAIRARRTYTLGAWKPGLVLPVGRAWVGVAELVEIGIPDSLLTSQTPSLEATDDESMRALLPVRGEEAHKGNHGHLLVVAGAAGMSGAAILAGRAALRGGSGLVTVAAPRSVCRTISGSLPEVMTHEFESFSESGWLERLERKSALVIGPGLGRSAPVGALVRWLARRAGLPLVLDADALWALGHNPAGLRRATRDVILTPHPGEMARLLDQSVQEVQADRSGAARRLAHESGAIVVLKGSGTRIASAEGSLSINTTGGPLLATAGTGDVLAGLVGSLLGQGLSAWNAARLAVFLHGRAADFLAERLGDRGLLASELADELPAAQARLRAPPRA